MAIDRRARFADIALISVGALIIAAVAIYILATNPSDNTAGPPLTTTASPSAAGSASSVPAVPAPDGPTVVRATLNHHIGRIMAPTPSMAGIEGRKLTLDFEGLGPAGAIDAFNAVSAVPIIYSADRLPAAEGHAVGLHLQNAPMLEALLELRAQAALRMYETTPAGITLLNGAQESSNGTWCVAGPFAVILEKIENAVDLSRPDAPPTLPESARNTMASLSNGRGGIGATMIVTVFAEPQIKVVQFPQELLFDQFVDDHGNAITADKPVYPTANLPRLSARTLTFALHLPANPGQRIRTLKGSAPFYVAIDPVRLETTAPDESRTEKVAGMEVELLPITGVPNNPTDFNINVRFKRGTLSDDAWKDLAAAVPAMIPEVTGSNGNALRQYSYTAVPEGDSAVLVHYAFRGPRNNTAQHFAIDVPMALRQVLVPFEFDNLVLP